MTYLLEKASPDRRLSGQRNTKLKNEEEEITQIRSRDECKLHDAENRAPKIRLKSLCIGTY